MTYNDLDLDLSELVGELLPEFGAVGTVEILSNTNEVSINESPWTTSTVFENIRLTPPTEFTNRVVFEDSIHSEFVVIKGLSCFVSVEDVTIEPIPDMSYLTIHQGNLEDTTVINKKLKIKNVIPIMSGQVVMMYELECVV